MKTQSRITATLPSIPAVALRLLGILSDPDAPTAEIVDLVQTDPAITAKILRAANSPFFGGGRNIDSLDRAVVWMGRHAITCMALSFSLSEKARDGGALNGYYKEYWLQSVIHALAMECLARRVDPSSSSAAFVAGLLMDIGRLALLQTHSSIYTSLLDASRSGTPSLVNLEQDELGTTHAEISAELLTAWSLPEAMVAVAKYHELPAQELVQRGEQVYFPQIAAANVAAATADFLSGANPMESFQRLEFLTSKLYQFSEAQLHEYLDSVSERLQATSQLLSADISEMPSTTELLAYATEQLSALSLQSLAKSTPSPDELQELRAKLYELEKRSCLDPLTAVYNRSYFDGRLGQRIRQRDEQSAGMGILFGDIDKFKRVNDTFGHAAGDAVLKAVAAAMRSCVRNTDVVARYGGEEFVVLAESSDPQVLTRLAERIRQKLAETTIHFGAQDIKVTISLGGVFVAAAHVDNEAPHQTRILAMADEAMYECKRRGGDTVAIKILASHGKVPRERHGSAVELTPA
jgi:diguanylate cyclase (GGDEF)-like protein